LTQTVKEKATQAVETVKEEANKAVQKVHETLEKATQPQIETPAQTPPHPSEPIQTPMPVETPPAG
jgi:LPS O-antigen subunit length determinant protein (WzzB/FepE family)